MQKTIISPICEAEWQMEFNKAVRLESEGKREEAEAVYESTARSRPDIWLGLGCCAMKDKRYTEALRSLERAARHAHNDELRALCLSNIGSIYGNRGNRPLAARLFRDAVALDPLCAEAVLNLGLSHHWKRENEKAMELYRKSLRLNPRLGQAEFCLSLLHLVEGRYALGWMHYEARYNQSSNVVRPDWKQLKPWHGGRIDGKRILLHGEQGAGDSIQMLRFCAEVRKLGASRIGVAVQPGVGQLALDAGLADEQIDAFESLDESRFDLECPLMSVPRVLRVTPETIPLADGYLVSESAPRAPGVRVGVVWSGSPMHALDAYRSTRLWDWSAVLSVPGIEFHSIQTGPGILDLHDEPRVIDHSEELAGGYKATARLIKSMDLVISVDTSVVHLAGALGHPCWMLVPEHPDWRWFYDRPDSPWYSSLRLFRQDLGESWGDVLARVADALSVKYPVFVGAGSGGECSPAGACAVE